MRDLVASIEEIRRMVAVYEQMAEPLAEPHAGLGARCRAAETRSCAGVGN